MSEVDLTAWLILTFHQRSDDEDRAAALHTFLRWQAGGPPQGGWTPPPTHTHAVWALWTDVYICGVSLTYDIRHRETTPLWLKAAFFSAFLDISSEWIKIEMSNWCHLVTEPESAGFSVSCVIHRVAPTYAFFHPKWPRPKSHSGKQTLIRQSGK